MQPWFVLTKAGSRFNQDINAQMAELVDALVSGTSGESRGGSSPLLGTKLVFRSAQKYPK